MEVPRTAPLAEATLRLSPDARRHRYLLWDPAADQAMDMPPRQAEQFLLARDALQSGQRPQALDTAAVGSMLTQIDAARTAAHKRRRPRFNPLFFSLPLLQVAPYQPRLRRIAALAYGWPGALMLAGLMLLCGVMATQSQFALTGSLDQVFSVDALLAFSLLAPVLKLFHELGHVLAATRFGVRVGRAGMMFVALYPLPFVDCSRADVTATRTQRIMISQGGLLADVTIGLCAFVAWHLTDSPWQKQLFGHVFLFNTLSTLLFNLNPLMKLDGYFALSDGLYRRNFHAQSSVALSRLMSTLGRGEFRAAQVLAITRWPQLLFAVAALIYKVYILAFITWMLLPRYYGLGALAVGWGAVLMFVIPRLAGASKPSQGAGTGRAWLRRRWPWLILALFGLLCLPLPHRLTLPVSLDVQGAYAVRAQEAGVLTRLSPPGPVEAGSLLALLRNPELDRAVTLAQQEVQVSEAAMDATRGGEPVAAQAASERRRAARDIAAVVAAKREALSVSAARAGEFMPDPSLRPGDWQNPGDRLGSLLPTGPSAALVGHFPELYAQRFRSGDYRLSLRLPGRHRVLDEDLTASLSRVEDRGMQAGRQLRIDVVAGLRPQQIRAGMGHLKIRFASEPVWRHLVFHARRLRLQYFQARALAQSPRGE